MIWAWLSDSLRSRCDRGPGYEAPAPILDQANFPVCDFLIKPGSADPQISCRLVDGVPLINVQRRKWSRRRPRRITVVTLRWPNRTFSRHNGSSVDTPTLPSRLNAVSANICASTSKSTTDFKRFFLYIQCVRGLGAWCPIFLLTCSRIAVCAPGAAQFMGGHQATRRFFPRGLPAKRAASRLRFSTLTAGYQKGSGGGLRQRVRGRRRDSLNAAIFSRSFAPAETTTNSGSQAACSYVCQINMPLPCSM